MFCPQCGNENEAGAAFCYNCGQKMPSLTGGLNGAGVGACATMPQSAKTFATAVNDEFERRALLSEAERLRNSLDTCRGAGVLLVILMLVGALLTFLNGSVHAGIVEYCIAVILGAVWVFFIPYGMAPIVDWTKSHGFFIIFSWIFLFVALVVIGAVACIAGPFYAIHAHKKIKECEQLASRL